MTIDSARSDGRTDPRETRSSSSERGPVAAVFPAALPAAARVKERRRPLLVASMVALVCAGGLTSAYAFSSSNDLESVVAVRESVARGEVIELEDLVTVQVSPNPALSPLPASEIDRLIGQRAAVDLSAGSLVTAESTTMQLVPADGQSIVGVSLTSAMMPSEPIYAGDTVRIVSTPGESGEVREGVEPVTVEATVIGLRYVDETGETVVDVAVPDDQAADLASRAATRKVALVLDSRER